MVEIKDNFPDFADKMKGKSELEPLLTAGRREQRRMISVGLGGRPRKFAGVITGQDIRSPVSSSGDFSGKIDLGFELPGPSELASHEEGIQRRKQFSKDKKIPVPISIPLPKKRDGRPDTPPKRPGPIGR